MNVSRWLISERTNSSRLILVRKLLRSAQSALSLIANIGLSLSIVASCPSVKHRNIIYNGHFVEVIPRLIIVHSRKHSVKLGKEPPAKFEDILVVGMDLELSLQRLKIFLKNFNFRFSHLFASKAKLPI